MMAVFNALVVSVLCVGLVKCNLTDFSLHRTRISSRQFRCKHPQPRALHLKEIVSPAEWTTKYKNHAKNIDPPETILYRCESAGCCGYYNKRCKPEEEEDVELTYFNKGSRKFIKIVAKNHTSCSCQDVDEQSIK